MKLNLVINGETKTFVYDFIPARVYRQMLEMQARENFDFNKMSPEEYDEVITIICKTYGDKFTIDEFYDGLAVDDFDKTIVTFINLVAAKKSHVSKNGEESGKPQANS
ncbi:hypothetical protein H4O14_02370 [Bacillus sp. PAMC26568]|nr:hypothetical protein H4O14_02370 [Bacillus sp. PAMC26568]